MLPEHRKNTRRELPLCWWSGDHFFGSFAAREDCDEARDDERLRRTTHHFTTIIRAVRTTPPALNR